MKIEIGGGFLGTLTIVFVILKALGYLDWSWWWVFSPVLIAPLVLIVGAISLIIFLLIIAIIGIVYDWATE